MKHISLLVKLGVKQCKMNKKLNKKAYKAYQPSPEGIAAEAKAKAAENHASILSLETSIQKAVRGYANINQLNVGDALDPDTLTKEGFWDVLPTPPDHSTFTFANVVPAQGVVLRLILIPKTTLVELKPLTGNVQATQK